MTYKISFATYTAPSTYGTWEDWTDFCVSKGELTKKVESENFGEAGAIVYDNVPLTFTLSDKLKNSAGGYITNLPLAAFTGSLDAKPRYLIKIEAFIPGDSTQIFIGMIDFSTIKWPVYYDGSEHIPVISFEVVDKLTAMNLLTAELPRDSGDIFDENIFTPLPYGQYGYADQIKWVKYSNDEVSRLQWFEAGYSSIATTLSNTPIAGDLLQINYLKSKQTGTSYLQSTDEFWGLITWRYYNAGFGSWVYMGMASDFGSYWAHTTDNDDSGTQDSRTVSVCKWWDNLFNDVDIYIVESNVQKTVHTYESVGDPRHANTVYVDEIQAIDAFKVIEALLKQKWPDITISVNYKSSVGAVITAYPMPVHFVFQLMSEYAFGKEPVDALKYIVNAIRAWIWIAPDGNAVIKNQYYLDNEAAPEGDHIIDTYVKDQFIEIEKSHFWDKLVDSVEVYGSSWLLDSTGSYYYDGGGYRSKSENQPRNPLKKDILITKQMIEDAGYSIRQTDTEGTTYKGTWAHVAYNVGDTVYWYWEGWGGHYYLCLVANTGSDSTSPMSTLYWTDRIVGTPYLSSDQTVTVDTILNTVCENLADEYFEFYGYRRNSYTISIGKLSLAMFNWDLTDLFTFQSINHVCDSITYDLEESTLEFEIVALVGTNYGVDNVIIQKQTDDYVSGGSSGGGSSTSFYAGATGVGDNLLWSGTDEQLDVGLARLNLWINLVENVALSTWEGSNYLHKLGTIASGYPIDEGSWQAEIIMPQYGGTGIANLVGETITLGGAINTGGTITTGGVITTAGDFVISGAYDLTLTLPSDCIVTFPDENGGTNTLVPEIRSISTTAPLSGGGDLSADKTLSLVITANRPVYNDSGSLNFRFIDESLVMDGSYNLTTVQDIRVTAHPQFEQLALGIATHTRDLTLDNPHDAGSVTFLSGWQGGHGWWLDSEDLSSPATRSIATIISDSDDKAIVTTDVPHGFVEGTHAEIVNCTITGWHGVYRVYSPASTTFVIYKESPHPTNATDGDAVQVQSYNYHLELDDLTIRGTLSVWELLVQQIRVTNGNLLVTAAAKIKAYTPGGSPYVTIEDVTGHGYAPFKAGDLVMIQIVNLGGVTTGDYSADGDDYTLNDGFFLVKRLIYEVASVSGLDVYLDEARGSGESLEGAPENKGLPEPGDGLVRFGSNTDADRQGMIGLYSDERYAPYIRITDDVSTWATWKSHDSMKGQFGNIEGISDTWFGSMATLLGTDPHGIYTKSFVATGDSFIAGTIYASAGGFGAKGSNHAAGYYVDIDAKGLTINNYGSLTPTYSGITVYSNLSSTQTETFIVNDTGYLKIGNATNYLEWLIGSGGSLSLQGTFHSSGVTGHLSDDTGFWMSSDGKMRFGEVGTGATGVLDKGIVWDGTHYDLKHTSNLISSRDSVYWDDTENSPTYGQFGTDNLYDTRLDDDMEPTSDITWAIYTQNGTANGVALSTTQAKSPTHSTLFDCSQTQTAASYAYSDSDAISTGLSNLQPCTINFWYYFRILDAPLHAGTIGNAIVTIRTGANGTGTILAQQKCAVEELWTEGKITFITDVANVYIDIYVYCFHEDWESGQNGTTRLYIDDILFRTWVHFNEITADGILFWNTPENYIQIGVDKFHISGQTFHETAVDFVVRGNLVVLGDTLIEGTATLTPPGYNNSNWDEAYGWGDHSTQGYIVGNETITLSGDVAGSGATSITTTIGATKVVGSMLNDDVISSQTELASGLVSTDELFVSDAGVLKRMDISVLETYITSGYFNTAGTGLTSSGSTINAIGGSGITANANDIALDINSLAVATLADGDFIPFWDITATADNKKITFTNFEATLEHDKLAGFVGDEHIDHTSVSVIAGAGMTGGGTIASDRTLNVIGTTDKITVSADAITIASTYVGQTSITTVGTLTSGAINWTGAITTTLGITAGSVTVDNIFIDGNTISTISSNNLNLNSSGDVVFNPTGNDILPANDYDLNLGSATYRYLSLHAAELWVNTLVAQDTITTTGGRLLVTNATELTVDINSSVTTITVKHNNLRNNDIIYLEKNGQIEFMQVTSTYTPNGSEWDYTVVRDKDGTGGNAWLAGDAVVNLGQTGDGFMELYSHHSIKQNVLDKIFNSDEQATSFSSNYSDSSDWELWDEDVTPDIEDCVYFGKSKEFYELYFYFGTAGSHSANFAYEYWNGSIWTALTNTITPDFEQTGGVGWKWNTPSGWTKNSVNSETLYWVRVRISGSLGWITSPVQSFQPVYEGGQQTGPTIVGYERNTNVYNEFTPRWAVGNLNGIYGNGIDIYGVAFGEFVTSGNSAYIQIDSTSGFEINAIKSGVSETVFSVNMSGVAYIGSWVLDGDDIYAEDGSSNKLIWLKTSTGETTPTDKAIILDGTGAAGVIYVGTAIDIDGATSGKITVGDITVEGASSGLITLGTAGKLRTSSGTTRIELYQNDLDIYNASTHAKIRYEGTPNFGIRFYHDYDLDLLTYAQFLVYSSAGLKAYAEEASNNTMVAKFGDWAGASTYGTLLSARHQDTVPFENSIINEFIINKSAFTTGWEIGWCNTSGVVDTNLYRSSAGNLTTDYRFNASLGETNPITNTFGITLGGTVAGTADTFIYRNATGALVLRQDVTVYRYLYFGGTTSTGGESIDTVLYRQGANTLKTNDSFIVGTNLTVDGYIIDDDIIYPEIVSITENTADKKWTIIINASKLNGSIGNNKRTLVRIWFSQWSTWWHAYTVGDPANTVINMTEGFLLKPSAREGGGNVTLTDTQPYEFVTNEAGELEFYVETTHTGGPLSSYMRCEIQGIIYSGTAISMNRQTD